jgi:translation initiation factor IF-2
MPGIVRRSPRAIRAGGPGEFGTAARPTPPPSLRDKAAAAGKVDAKPKEPAAQKPVARLTTDEQQRKARQARDVTTLNKALLSTGAITETKPVAPVEEEDDLERKRAGGVIGRADRHAQRKQRLEKRKTAVVITDGRVEEIEDNRPIRGGRKHIKPKKLPGTVAPKGPTIIQVPITVRDLSAALGEKLGKLLIKVLELGLPKTTNVNSMLDGETAEMIALEMGKEVEIRRAADVEDKLKAGAGAEDNPEEMVERAPVVTIMGHVDHGKTSLLDRIRSSDVAGDEVGGITQVIRAWRVEHDGRPITFLDTPGHQAFTKMRARGAQVTDIAVIVVAADDGVMPQTEEAISHAKAAGVQLVIAINKVDLPNSNVLKTKQQLYSLDVLPDDMGGDTPFVETSAATGRGIDDLLEAILVAAELRELKSNPNKPAHGTCLEAHKEGDEGVFATVLVQHGTLRKGDVVICGASFGRVRAMYNDHNQLIDEAGPSVPVRITGLNEVPDASDSFHVVADLSAAREIAEKRHEKMLDAALIRRMPVNVDTFGQRKIDELKIILKADFRGSIEAIRAELEKLKHDEVRVRILHTGIGGITESDVELALTSPQDTMILGFNAVPDDAALALADSRGVKVREYNIIYELTNDVKAALEGRLKPREEIIHLGRALIRETFKISKVGTVAGCYVTSGVIERSSKIRVIREGVVVYPPADKTIGLESLKHFKDDVREVKQGYECGLKINGYDDIKVGDVIEAYRIEQVQRTL